MRSSVVQHLPLPPWPACLVACIFSAFWVRAVNAQSLAEPFIPDDTAISSLLQENCFDCHGGGESEGNLQLDALLLMTHGPAAAAEPPSAAVRNQWWSVLKNIRAGTMPPPDSGYALDGDQVESLVQWLKFRGLGINSTAPDPGQVTVRRLNRREYSATIRDLMGINFNADIIFPPDDTGFGFDTVGDALNFSPLTVEKYLASAKQIVDAVVPRQTTVIATPFTSSKIKTTDGKSANRISMAEPVDVELKFEIEEAEAYRLRLKLEADGTFEYCPDRCQVTFRLDGQQLEQASYGWDNNHEYLLSFDRSLAKGSHQLLLEIRPAAPDQTREKASSAARSYLAIEEVVVEGPTKPSAWINPPGYAQFFPRERLPEDAAQLQQYAFEILDRFCLRAFRRPTDKQTLDKLVAIATEVYQQPDKTFEDGIAAAFTTCLASPRFLLRYETSLPPDASSNYPLIDEYSLASRLSYFLWSSMPDEKLFALAEAGELRENLAEQVQRMLADPKSDAFIKSFVGQWLRTNDVSKVTVDSLAAFGLREQYDLWREEYGLIRDIEPQDRTPAESARYDELRAKFKELSEYRDLFNGDTRKAMQRETEMLVEHILRESRPLIEIINPGYTFLNQRLAELYQIDGVEGKEMRMVSLPADSPRGGILTQGTLLTVTSNPTRTSPVKRGLYILENILGTPTPPAPPDIPELELSKERFGGREPTLRELLAVHRESALCSSCHSRMDPLGLALENFNALGIWQTEEAGQSIDPSGVLITGEAFANVVELREVISNDRRADFYRCLTQKLFTYALGRGVEYYDEHTCDEIVESLLAGDGSFDTLVTGIIQSSAFQRRRTATPPTAANPQPQRASP